MSEPRPPRLSGALLRWAADPRRRDAQLGDLAEEFAERARSDVASARRWYRRQALRSLAPNLAYRARRVFARRVRQQGDGIVTRLGTDLRQALRGFVRDRAFHTVLLITLGLGIGAIATTFSVMHGLVLNPFPFPEASRIVGVGTAYPRLGADLGFFENMSPAEYEDVRDNATTLDDVVAWDMGNRQLDAEGPPQNVFTAFWWGDPLTTLQMDAHLGRSFSPDEVRTGAAVAMLGYDTWVSAFGADSSMIGEPIGVNGYPYDLVGVIPPGVDIYGTELWTPMGVGPERFERGRRQFQTLARMRSGVTLDEVNAELDGIARRVEQAYGSEFEEYVGWSIHAMTWASVSSQSFRTGVFVLMGAVTFLLLLVCANTANLLLARAQSRRREMAVRTALGAVRSRLVSQLLTESVAIGLGAGALGVGLAWLGVRGIEAFIATIGLGVAGSIELNGSVLAFAAAVAVGAGILFGLAPAVQGSSGGVAGALQAEARGSTGTASRHRLQRTLVGIQVALAFVLLTGGGLLINSFVRVSLVNPGFDVGDVLTMRLTLPREEYGADAVPIFFDELTTRLGALPGIVRVSAGTQYPGVAFAFREISIDGPESDATDNLPVALVTTVTRGYFGTLGIPLVRGRAFDSSDGADTPPVVVVNEEAARRYFAGEDPIGRMVKVGDDPATEGSRVVGVVGSARNLGLDRDPFPEVFGLHEQVGGVQNQLFLLVRTEREPEAIVEAVRATVSDMDADQPVYAIRTIEETLASGVAPIRAMALFLSVFAGFSLVLAAIGVYSVVSLTVGERTQEIGVRVALGADSGRVRRLVVRQALLPVGVGAGVGGLVAIALAGALQRVLFEVSGTDPLTIGSVGLLLVGVAAIASWVPAFRAARLHPVEALRSE